MADTLSFLIQAIADMSGVAEATGALNNLEGATQDSAAAAGEAGSATTDLTGFLGGLSAVAGGAAAAAIAALAKEMYAMGSAAERTENTLDTLTGGRGTAWAQEMKDATHGLLDDTDAAAIASKLLAEGLITTSSEAAHMAQVATTLGAAFKGMGAAEATESIANMLNNMSARPLKEFGINIETLQSRMKELKETTTGLSDQQAFSMAFFEQADPLAAKLAGTLDDSAAAADKLSNSLGELGERASKMVSAGLEPAARGALAISDGFIALDDAIQKQKQNLIQTSSTWEEYRQGLNNSNIDIGQNTRAASQAREEYSRLRAEWVRAGEDKVELNRLQRDGALAAHEEAEANEAAAAAQAKATEAAKIHAEAMLGQDAIYLKTLTNIDALTTGQTGLAGAFSTGTQMLSQMGLSTTEMLGLYGQLGLVTGEVTGKQLEQTKALTDLTQRYAEGLIGPAGYAKALSDISAGADAATVRLATVSEAIMAVSRDAGTGALDMETWRSATATQAGATSDLTSTVDTLIGKVDGLSQMKPEIKMQYAKVLEAKDATKALTDALLTMPTSVNVVVNFSATGDPAAINAMAGSPP